MRQVKLTLISGDGATGTLLVSRPVEAVDEPTWNKPPAGRISSATVAALDDGYVTDLEEFDGDDWMDLEQDGHRERLMTNVLNGLGVLDAIQYAV